MNTSSHAMSRVDVSTAMPFDDFRSRFRHAATTFGSLDIDEAAIQLHNSQLV